jgi:HD superfamily phosphohydrolase
MPEDASLASDRWPTERILKEIKAAYLDDDDISEFWSAEEVGVLAAINSIGPSLPADRYRYKGVLGVGGSGIVLRLGDDIFTNLDSALKFPRPVAGKISLVADMLAKEMAFLADLRHPGIVRILYYREIQGVDVYGSVPFYLMEVVDGLRSDKYVHKISNQFNFPLSAQDTAKLEAALLKLFRNVADTLRYLHQHPEGERVHLDLKPENIVVDATGQPIMIDLGTCKRILSDQAETIVACTLPMAAPSLARQLAKDPTDQNRAHGPIVRDEISTTWDLWALGISILRWLDLDPSNGEPKAKSVAMLISPYARKFLLLLVARLLANEKPEDMLSWISEKIGLSKTLLRSMSISTAAESLELLGRLDNSSNPIATVKELAPRALTTMQPSEGQHIPMTSALTELLNHPLVKRLDSIAQLGLVVEVYPEARHTRKEHSLGAYAYVAQYIHALYNDPVSPLFKQWITPGDCRDVLLAALLHDIGHFPLAHDLEDIDQDLFDHGDLTIAMLRGTFDKKKAGATKIEFPQLESMLEQWQTTAERIMSVLNAKPTSVSDAVLPKSKLLRSFISGAIDADKIDYLLRDADRMHLPYPKGIDVDRILKSLTIVVIERVPGGARDVPVIGVHSKGKVAAEFVSIARYAMFSQGYWHHTVRSMKAMLTRAVQALVALATDEERNRFQSAFITFVMSIPESLYERGPSQMTLLDTSPSTKSETKQQGGSAVVPQLALTDVATLKWLQQQLISKKRPEASLIDGLLKRRLFKRLWVVSRDMEQMRWDEIIRLWSNLPRSKRFEAAYEFEKLIAKQLSEKGPKTITEFPSEKTDSEIQLRIAQRTPWLLIDIPGTKPGADVGLFYVLEGQRRQLRKDERVSGSIQESDVWKQYARDLFESAGKIRVFCDSGLSDPIEASLEWQEGIEQLVNALTAVGRV